MNDYSSLFEQIQSILEESNSTLTDIEGIMSAISGIFSVLAMGAYAGLWIIGGIILFVVGILYFIFESIPIYVLAKRVGYKYAWLAWMPFFHDYCRVFVLCETAGNRAFEPNIGKFRIENRKMSFLLHIGIKYLGGAIIGTLITTLSFILPGIGSLSSILSLVPSAACAFIEYVYLRDLLDVYKPDRKANSNSALIVSVIDFFLVGDLIRTCYLYTLIKKQPLPASEFFVEDVTVSETVPVGDDMPLEN